MTTYARKKGGASMIARENTTYGLETRGYPKNKTPGLLQFEEDFDIIMESKGLVA